MKVAAQFYLKDERFCYENFMTTLILLPANEKCDVDETIYFGDVPLQFSSQAVWRLDFIFFCYRVNLSRLIAKILSQQP